MLNTRQQSLSTIIEGCRKISQQARKREARTLPSEKKYCFELFRRAIEDGNNQAWEALKQQYDGLIHHWIIGSSGAPLSLEDREDLVQDTWANFHRALKKYNISLAKYFEHVGALLKFLNNCAYTATMKHWKRRQKAKRLQEKLTKIAPKAASAPEKATLTQILTEERRAALKKWREQRVTEPHEQLVFDCSFKQSLKPKQIADAYPEMFPNAKVVYRIKDNLIKRAKRYFE
ncbi:MAG: RNA polymerase sigma factor [Ardenticatenaceae bacterium]